MSDNEFKLMSRRFRGFYPVVVDVETGGFDDKNDALLEIGAVTLKIDENGTMTTNNEYQCHINPFEGANMDPASLEVNGIDPHHPFRIAIAKDEETAVREIATLFLPQQSAIKYHAIHFTRSASLIP